MEKSYHSSHKHTVWQELICHFPYAVFSVTFALALLSFFEYFSLVNGQPPSAVTGASMLFHSFHFMHIAFATTGTLITFFRFSKNYTMAFLLGFFGPAFFCMLSDSILPYIGGRLLGVPMEFHLCFVSELKNVLPFLFIGMLNGFLMSRHQHSNQSFYSLFSHAAHILISSLASSFYLVAHGFSHWYDHIGLVFLFLVGAVVVPCTLSDVVVPILFAKPGRDT